MDLSVVANIFSIISSIAVIISIFIAVNQIVKMRKANELSEKNIKLTELSFKADHTRRLRQSTIDFYNDINKETMSLIDKVLVDNETYNIDTILNNAELHKVIRRYLALMERFSVGINSYMYDIRIFDRIQGATTIKMYEALKPYLEYARGKYGEYFYCDFELVVNQIKKLREQRAKEGYKGATEVFDKYQTDFPIDASRK